MSTPAADRRAGPDACPGALRLHAAADGPLARVRVPGGALSGAQLAAVRAIAEEHGDGQVELTSRANLQLRALTGAAPGELAARLRAAGLLPSDTHETVRNVLASPLSGRDRRSRLDVRPLTPALDRALCAEPRLADLPGRFLFALDDGRGDVAGRADLAVAPALDGPSSDDPASAGSTGDGPTGNGPRRDGSAGGDVAVLFGGVDAGLRVARADAVGALLAAAHAFLDERRAQGGQAWRLAELVDGPARVAARAAATLGVTLAGDAAPVRFDAGLDEPVGQFAQPDGLVAVGTVVPLGKLGGVPLKLLTEATALVVTPWRGVVVPDLPPAAAPGWLRALADAGLATAPGSRWSGVTACAGRPGCAQALADVRAAASAAATEPADGRPLLPVHWIGCPRGCGSPAAGHVRVEATTSGYAVTSAGSTVAARPDQVADLVAAARRNGT